MNRLLKTLIATIGLALAATPVWSEDSIELLSGSVVRGEVTARSATDVTIKLMLSGQTITRKYPLSRIQSITIAGKTESINKPAQSSQPSSVVGDPANRRTKQQVLAFIAQQGKTPPDWFAATPLNFPPTLDLSWPHPPPKGWNNQANVGAYFWDIINPNPSRWPSGIKLLHHMLALNQDKADVVERIQLHLANIYFSHLNDYARAAYWLQIAGAENTDEFSESSAKLAECYFHLGNKQMAADLLNRISDRNSVVKVWTTLGETDKALEIANRLLAEDGQDSQTLMYTGDACRIAGRYELALTHYQRVLDLGPPGDNGRLKRNQGRARASIDAIRLFEQSDVSKVPDGTYTAQSLGYEGQVTVEVTVRAKKIATVRVVKHTEKQFYGALTDTPARIIAKQSVKGVDTTSNATLTSEAIINATAKALAAATK
jgi:uncharacterized protein with FMN-binding domain